LLPFAQGTFPPCCADQHLHIEGSECAIHSALRQHGIGYQHPRAFFPASVFEVQQQSPTIGSAETVEDGGKGIHILIRIRDGDAFQHIASLESHALQHVRRHFALPRGTGFGNDLRAVKHDGA